MARPPISKFFSTISTDAPFSRAAMAATSPPAPAPDDEHVNLAIPHHRFRGLCGRHLGDGGGADHRARGQKAAPVDCRLGVIFRVVLGTGLLGRFRHLFPPLDRLPLMPENRHVFMSLWPRPRRVNQFGPPFLKLAASRSLGSAAAGETLGAECATATDDVPDHV